VKILILKPSSLGDVIQALPVLRLLRRQYPDSEIYWWIETALIPLLEGDPDIAGLIPFERRHWTSPKNWLQLARGIMELRRMQFDWVLDLQSLARSGAVAWLANGGLLVGLDDAREGARGFYDIIVPRPDWFTHAVDWYLGALPHLGVAVDKRFEWLPPRPHVAAAVRKKWNLDERTPWAIFVPGARWVNKRWPVEYFAETARRIVARHPELRIAVIGGADDGQLGKAIAEAAPAAVLDLTGKTDLPEMIEWIRLGRVVLTNDTGPMHVAAALGRPVVALFGPTEPRRTGPYGQLHNVVRLPLECVPCMKGECRLSPPMQCMSGISPGMVLQRLEAALAGNSSGNRQPDGPLQPQKMQP